MKSGMFLGQFLRDMRAQKTRTILTLFGITWGTVSIALLLGFGTGVGRQMSVNMHGMGQGLMIVWPARTSRPFFGLGKGRALRFREEDAALLAAEIPDIESVSPEYFRSGVELRFGKQTYSGQIRGVLPVYADMRNVIPSSGGRFLDDLDVRNKRRVIFLGDKLKDELFRSGEAVGSYLSVNGIPFQVVGSLKPKRQNSSYNGRDEYASFIPVSTFAAVFGQRYISDIVVQAVDPARNVELRKDINRVLGRKYRFDPEDMEAVAVWDMTEGERITDSIMLGFNLFVGIVGAFTLIVGGIGVSNIMNVVVEERRKEIGLKMAIGARKRFVLSQFLFETLFITAVGGSIGLGLSAFLIAVFPTTGVEEEIGRPVFSLETALVAVAVLGFVGLVSGLGPARRAAGLNPVDALRS
jgi:putative ABC transport system permease protein